MGIGASRPDEEHPPRGDPGAEALDPSKVGTGAWLGVAYIIIFPTVFAYVASTWAVRRSSPTLVTAYSILQSLVASALAAAFLARAPSGPPGERRRPSQQFAAETHGRLELLTVKKFTVPQVPVIPPAQGTTV